MQKDRQREIGNLQARWQAADRFLGEAMNTTEGGAPAEVEEAERQAWQKYQQVCIEAGICTRIDCYLYSQRRGPEGEYEVSIFCPKHQQEVEARERHGEEQ